MIHVIRKVEMYAANDGTTHASENEAAIHNAKQEVRNFVQAGIANMDKTYTIKASADAMCGLLFTYPDAIRGLLEDLEVAKRYKVEDRR